MKIVGMVRCTWCEAAAITTVVHQPACKLHHDLYHIRRRAGDTWLEIERSFQSNKWVDEIARAWAEEAESDAT